MSNYCNEILQLRYKIADEYILRQIGDEYVIIPVGNENIFTHTMAVPNESAAWLWQLLSSPISEEEVIQKTLFHYKDAEEKEIREDVHRYIVELLRYGILQGVEEDDLDKTTD